MKSTQNKTKPDRLPFLSTDTLGALLLLFSLLLTAGCGHQKTSAACPFSDATWGSTSADIIRTQGDSDNVYSSVYGGNTYVYPGKYQEKEGSVKYMFDEDDQLACVSWTTSADSEEELHDLYDAIRNEIKDTAGNDGNPVDGSGNYGTVWYLKSGNIILSVVATDTQKALQYSCISPDHSDPEPDR